MEAARLLAAAASATRFDEAPGSVRAAYRDFMLDTLAVMAAGAAHPSVTAARKAFVASGGEGRASVAGFTQGSPPAVAGMVNGLAMTVLQLQDGHRRARGHPMSHVLPAALAVAEQTGASGAAFLDAVMAGYEVSARIGASLGGMQPLLHDTGTFGCIGATVATAHLLGGHLQPAEHAMLIEMAIGNAASVALFPFRDTCMEGAGVHHLFVGMGVQNGIQAAQAAFAGLRPSGSTLERFFGPRAGEAFDARKLTDGISGQGIWCHYEITEAYLKWHPVCAHLSPVLDCIEALRARLGNTDPAQIDRVLIEIYATALQYNAPHPESDLAARFSFRHAAALALRFGPLRHDGFADERLRHPEVEALVRKTVLQADPRLDGLYPANRPARVTLAFADASEESAEVMVPKGDGARSLTRADVDMKAFELMDAAWAQGRFDVIRELIDTVEGMPARDLAADLGRAMRTSFRT